MTTPKEPRENTTAIKQESDNPETLSLVDFFDRMDRETFRRDLGDRDRTDPVTSGS
jgi:hypothetical protein